MSQTVRVSRQVPILRSSGQPTRQSKTADSSAFVLSAGLCPAPSSYEPYTYLTAMYAAGAHGYFDAMNMHPYITPTLLFRQVMPGTPGVTCRSCAVS